MELVEIFVTLGFWAALVRMATPLIFGTLGELICERAGVLNLGIEGIMTMGAMVAWMWVYQGGDLWTAVLVAAAAGSVPASRAMRIMTSSMASSAACNSLAICFAADIRSFSISSGP